MKTVKKISTLLALALISQSSFATEMATDTTNTNDSTGEIVPDTTDTTTLDPFIEAIVVDTPANVAYNPTEFQMDAGGDVRSAMQNTLQSASVGNATTLSSEMPLTNVYSDVMNNMTSNANATNYNTGSSYNDSTNTINTTSTDSSTNTNTTTLDSGTTLTQPAASV